MDSCSTQKQWNPSSKMYSTLSFMFLHLKQHSQAYGQALQVKEVKVADYVHKLIGKYAIHFTLPEASTQVSATAE